MPARKTKDTGHDGEEDLKVMLAAKGTALPVRSARITLDPSWLPSSKHPCQL